MVVYANIHNPVMISLLSSPWHSVMSGKFVIIKDKFASFFLNTGKPEIICILLVLFSIVFYAALLTQALTFILHSH